MQGSAMMTELAARPAIRVLHTEWSIEPGTNLGQADLPVVDGSRVLPANLRTPANACARRHVGCHHHLACVGDEGMVPLGWRRLCHDRAAVLGHHKQPDRLANPRQRLARDVRVAGLLVKLHGDTARRHRSGQTSHPRCDVNCRQSHWACAGSLEYSPNWPFVRVARCNRHSTFISVFRHAARTQHWLGHDMPQLETTDLARYHLPADRRPAGVNQPGCHNCILPLTGNGFLVVLTAAVRGFDCRQPNSCRHRMVTLATRP